MLGDQKKTRFYSMVKRKLLKVQQELGHGFVHKGARSKAGVPGAEMEKKRMNLKYIVDTKPKR